MMKSISFLTALFASLAFVSATPMPPPYPEPSEAYAKRSPEPAPRIKLAPMPSGALVGRATEPKASAVAEASSPHQTSNFTLTSAPYSLDWDWNPIVFDNGVPVGGWAHLSIRQDGSYTFSGHFHDSGATSYDMAIAWGVKDAQNRAYTFQHTCHVAGTFEPGSRDCDWAINSYSSDIANYWSDITASWTYNAQANADWDIWGTINNVVKALGVVASVIAIV